MAIHGIINENAKGTTFPAPLEQAVKKTHTHTHIFADLLRHYRPYAHTHTVYEQPLACVDTHTEADYFVLSKQSLLGSTLVTPRLYQSIEPALGDPFKPKCRVI